MFCTRCGASMSDGQRFCPSCGAATEAAGATPPRAAEFVAPSGCRARTGAWIGEGWRLMTGQVGLLMLISLLMCVLSGTVPMILQGAMMCGMFVICWRILLGGRADVGDLFKGFNFFVPALLASLVICAFTFLGALACLVGALVVAAMFQFTYLFIIDRRLDFWPAMKASHAVVKQDYLGFTLFTLALGLLQVVGVLACLVGLLVTIPLQFMAITVAYRELVGFATPAPPQ